MPFSGQVMFAENDGTANDEAYARLDIAGLPNEVWVEFDLMIPQATLDAWLAGGPDTPDLVEFHPGGEYLTVFHTGTAWEWAVGTETGGSVSGDVVYRIRLHWNTTANTVTLRVNGADVFTDTGVLATITNARLGLMFGDEAVGVYFDNVIVSAVAGGGTDLLDNDFETAIVPDFTSIVGDVSRVAAPEVSLSFDIVGVGIAFDDTLLEPDPIWTRIDNQMSVAKWEIRRGRQGELEKTNTAEATVFVNDTAGVLDPSNETGPYYGNLDGKQLAIARWNPVTEEWSTRFRGYITGYSYNLSPTQQVNYTEIHAVGFMGYLARAEMVPGDGDVGGPVDMVFYDNEGVNERIEALLADADFPAALSVVFSGNVNVMETLYDPGYSFLAGIQDAADAEFPGVANVYEDRFGRVVFHGRHARFDPDNVAADAGDAAWDFQRWKAGDGAAIAGDSAFAQIRPLLGSDRTIDLVINRALVTPLDIEAGDLTGQIVNDATSRLAYGLSSYTATDLRVLEHKTNGDTGLEQCLKVAQYYVTNYAEPRQRPRAVTLRSLRATDPRATSTWALICGVDVADVVTLRADTPGGFGFDEDFYVEGITESSAPLGPAPPLGPDMAEIALDLSPVAFYTEDTFTDDAT